jgi:hypothetical protein
MPSPRVSLIAVRPQARITTAEVKLRGRPDGHQGLSKREEIVTQAVRKGEREKAGTCLNMKKTLKIGIAT